MAGARRYSEEFRQMADISNAAKMGVAATGFLALAAVAAVAVGTFLPPNGMSSGTIAPVDRYRASQVGSEDITLGDQSVPQDPPN